MAIASSVRSKLFTNEKNEKQKEKKERKREREEGEGLPVEAAWKSSFHFTISNTSGSLLSTKSTTYVYTVTASSLLLSCLLSPPSSSPSPSLLLSLPLPPSPSSSFCSPLTTYSMEQSDGVISGRLQIFQLQSKSK